MTSIYLTLLSHGCSMTVILRSLHCLHENHVIAIASQLFFFWP